MDRNIYDKSQVAEPDYYQEKFRPSQLSELTLHMKVPSPCVEQHFLVLQMKNPLPFAQQLPTIYSCLISK